MNIEFEATFAGIVLDDIRKKLRGVGARLEKPERILRRVTFHPPRDLGTAYLRVRDEGDKVTMSVKVFTGTSQITDQKEIDLIIDDFERGVSFFKALGAKQKAYQETKREEWVIDGVHIALDTWPGLRPFIEIEGSSESEVRLVAERLGFQYRDAIFGPVGIIAERELGIPQHVLNNETAEITFEKPLLPYRAS